MFLIEMYKFNYLGRFNIRFRQQLYLGDKKSEQASEMRDFGLQLLFSGKTPSDQRNFVCL
jgi:hypothetical protein